MGWCHEGHPTVEIPEKKKLYERRFHLEMGVNWEEDMVTLPSSQTGFIILMIACKKIMRTYAYIGTCLTGPFFIIDE